MLMDRLIALLQKPKVSRWGLFLIFISILFFGLYTAQKYYLINTSPSMQLGIYQIEHSNDFNRGDIVAICLDDANIQIGLKRGYIAPGNRCHQSEPLIKQIIAIPDDDVFLMQDKIVVNGNTFKYITLNKDSKGRVLNSIKRGKYFNTSGYWLIGTNDPKSWDSRYWGAINSNQILFKLKPLWLF